MGAIYSGAEKVVVWLGKDMADFNNFAWIHSDALASEYLQGSQTDSIMQRLNAEAPIFEGAHSSEPGFVRKWYSYCRFFEQRRWFNRAWVVEEIVLARPSDIEVWCGSGRLSWTNMVAFALGLRASGIAIVLQLAGENLKNLPIGDEVIRLGLLQEYCERGGLDQESSGRGTTDLKTFLMHDYGVTDPESRRHAFLLSVLSTLRPYDSRDPRDKVYAALGIVDSLLPRGSRSFIYPGYETPVREVYECTTKFLLEHLPYLCILTLVEDPSQHRNVNLPSWVPDFSLQHGIRSNPLQIIAKGPYNASAGQPPGPSCFLKDSILSLRGGCHDTVAQIGIAMLMQREGHLHNILAIIDDALRLCSTLDPTYINGQSRIQALGRTMIANQESSPAEFLHLFRCWRLWSLATASDSRIERVTDLLESIMYRMAFLNESALSEEDVLLAPPSLAQYATQDGVKPEQQTVEPNATVEEMPEDSHMFSLAFSYASINRRFYTISKGYIGLGPESTQVGDEVWIICDAETPFVLHPQPENSNVPNNSNQTEEAKQFQLVGETYLHGFMNGEALESGLLHQLRWIELI